MAVMVPCMVTLLEPPRQSVMVCEPSLGLGVAVSGLGTFCCCNCHGPAHPAGPDHRFHAPPVGTMSATWLAGKAVTTVPATVNGVDEVTITWFPSFSVMSTRTVVASWGPERPARLVPP